MSSAIEDASCAGKRVTAAERSAKNSSQPEQWRMSHTFASADVVVGMRVHALWRVCPKNSQLYKAAVVQAKTGAGDTTYRYTVEVLRVAVQELSVLLLLLPAFMVLGIVGCRAWCRQLRQRWGRPAKRSRLRLSDRNQGDLPRRIDAGVLPHVGPHVAAAARERVQRHVCSSIARILDRVRLDDS
jgi:hypothetical protein